MCSLIFNFFNCYSVMDMEKDQLQCTWEDFPKESRNLPPKMHNLMGSLLNSRASLLCALSRLYVHSAVENWKKCLHSIKLKDSVLSLV